MNGRKNGSWNKCTDPQCQECVESRVIYGVSPRELIDVCAESATRRTKSTTMTTTTATTTTVDEETPTQPGASLYPLPITDPVNIHKS